ncbi:uncharacterized protein LOC127286770 [Leptopilina boulardi]|uniref:uncharacterized protein LOC127286770 n=1 Tax=Leptopilina boulardi TaxID=63433 RepID=UPI0021F51935|nr:uncharacterized protein LOC127286770 [Leptopilina boulardi]
MTTIDDLKELMLSVQSDVKSSNNKMDNLSEEVKLLKNSQGKLMEELKTCKSKYLVLEKKSARFGQQISSIEKKLEIMDIKDRSRNIIAEKTNLIKSVQMILEKASITIPDEHYEAIYPLGKKDDPRPILIKFSSSKYRECIFQNAKNLRSLNVFFSTDYTPEQQQTRKELKQFQAVLNEQGKSSSVGSRKRLRQRKNNISGQKKIKAIVKDATIKHFQQKTTMEMGNTPNLKEKEKQSNSAPFFPDHILECKRIK